MKNYKKPKSGWKLLGKSSTKTEKGQKLGYITYIMYLAPHTQNSKGINLCPFASKGCIKACLFSSGRGRFTSVEKARINKTNFYVENRQTFLKQLCKNINTIVNRHKKDGKKFCIRLNGTSDLNWIRQKIDGKNIFETYPDIQFYDYTKNHYMILENSFSNYHLTFSRSEKNEVIALNLLSDGFNVAMVFENELPEYYKGYKVINGDESDLRFLDEKGVIVGLTYKKSKDKDVKNNPFIISKEDILKYGSNNPIPKVVEDFLKTINKKRVA